MVLVLQIVLGIAALLALLGRLPGIGIPLAVAAWLLGVWFPSDNPRSGADCFTVGRASSC